MLLVGVNKNNVKVQNASGTSSHNYNKTKLTEIKNYVTGNFVTISGDNDFVENHATDSTISIKGGAYQQIEIYGDRSKIYTGDSADTIYIKSSSNNTVNSGVGSNVISVEGSSNSIVSGSANDTITYKGAANIIYAGDGKNVIKSTDESGGDGNTIFAGTGNDTVYVTDAKNNVNAGAGNNYINATNGASNSIVSYSGADTIEVEGSSNTIDIGSGNDIIIFDSSHDKNVVIFGGDYGQDTVVNFAESDTPNFGFK